MRQLELSTAPFQPVSTSYQAAKEIEPHMNMLQRRVLAAIERRHEWGMTDREIEEALDLIGSTARPRRRELQLSGLIRDSGKRRKTASGRNAVVWVAV